MARTEAGTARCWSARTAASSPRPRRPCSGSPGATPASSGAATWPTGGSWSSTWCWRTGGGWTWCPALLLYRATDQSAAGGELQVPGGDGTPGWRAGAGGAGVGDRGLAAARPRGGHGGLLAAEVREQDPAHPGLGLQQGQGSSTQTLQVQMIIMFHCSQSGSSSPGAIWV